MKNFNSKRIAILIDGSFFLKRYRIVTPGGRFHQPKLIVENLYKMAMKHAKNYELYRILFYDCMPLKKRDHNPLNGKAINYSKTQQYKNRIEIFEELRKRRKVALRLGEIKYFSEWNIHHQKIKPLLKGEISIKDLQERDIIPKMKQTGIDIKIGLDIASIAYKKLSDQIVLISGDSDFVPAAKLARREGMDFILDPMWSPIRQDLYEHIDGLKSHCRNPNPHKNQTI